MKPHIAILDDHPRMAEVLAMVLESDEVEVTTWNDPGEFLASLDRQAVDLLLTDLKMPGLDGVEVLERAQRQIPGLPVILITAHGTVESAVEAMKLGAFDYLNKPVDNDECRATVSRALEFSRLTRENRWLRAQLSDVQGAGSLVAASRPMQQVLDLVVRAARSTSTVLITGESGTGKEVLARAIHVESDRVAAPFVPVNCSALASGVLESELFGHEKGAFTGASSSRAGLFEQANGGTVFLDEIGDVEPAFQAKLLRVLQEREIRRVGGDCDLSVDVRVVAATNRNLSEMVESGEFREDLYFRLNVIPLHIPPLRERPADILPLGRLFLTRTAREQRREVVGWNDDVEAWLLQHPWPGNVRELENTIERGVVMARDEVLTLDDLMLPTRDAAAAAGDTLQDHLDRASAARIRQALERSQGVRVEAARELGVERTTLYRLMKRYGID